MTTTLTIAGLELSTRYRLMAVVRAGNRFAFSEVVEITTPGGTPAEPTPMEVSERLHWESMKRMSGRVATYFSGEETRSPIVVQYSPRSDRLDFDGIPLYHDSKIFLIGTDEIAEPVKDDVIELSGLRWRVTPLGDGPCWTEHGKYGYVYKVHTRRKYD